MIFIGEKLNSSIKNTYEALAAKDISYIKKTALDQLEKGADYIDINAGAFKNDEYAYLEFLFETVREVTNAPLAVDSSDYNVIKKLVTEKNIKGAILNSVSLEKERFEVVSDLAAKTGNKVVALCMDDKGMPTDTAGIVAMAKRMVEALENKGLKKDDIYLDPLVKPVSTMDSNAKTVLNAIKSIREMYPEVHIVCGASNVSFGLPKRQSINRVFITLCIAAGMDAAIADVLDSKLMSDFYIADMLLGNDEFCMNFILKYKENLIV